MKFASGIITKPIAIQVKNVAIKKETYHSHSRTSSVIYPDSYIDI